MTVLRNDIGEYRGWNRAAKPRKRTHHRHQTTWSARIVTSMIFCTLSVTCLVISKACLSSPQEADESKETRIPNNYFVAQTAGYLGFIAMGMGRDYQRHTISALLGYVPEGIGGVEIWQLSLKYEWHPFTAIPLEDQRNNTKLNPFYIGMSLIYGMHNDLFVDEPGQYPDGYYPPTALRSTLNMGVSLIYGKKYTLFVEYAALDTGLVAYVKHPEFFMDNYDFFGLEGIGSLAVGIKIKFE